MPKAINSMAFFIKYPPKYKVYLMGLYLCNFKLPLLKNLLSWIPSEFVSLNHYLHELGNSILLQFKILKGEVLLTSNITRKEFKAYARMQSSDLALYEQIFVNNSYQRLITILQSNNITPKVMLDCGCNVGYVSLYLSLYFKGMEFYCVEPDKGNFLQIAKNVTLNEKNYCKIYQKALWSTQTTLYLNNNFRDGKNWSFNTSTQVTETKVDTITIMNIIKENNIECIDILKIDVEGAEKEIFEDDTTGCAWLDKTRVVVIEIHDEFNCRNNIERILREHHFEIVEDGELTYGINKKQLQQQ